MSLIAAVGEKPRAIRESWIAAHWRWIAVCVAPLALIAVDVGLLGTLVFGVAPAGLATLAVVGPVVFLLSHLRLSELWGDAVAGALAASWVLVWAIFAVPYAVTLVFTIGILFVWPVILLFNWPLLFAAAAIRHQMRLRVSRLTDLRKGPVLAGAASLLAVVGAPEAADRIYFASLLEKASSPVAAEAIEGYRALSAYPLASQRSASICWAVLDAASLTKRTDELNVWFDQVYGADAGRVRKAAAAVVGDNVDGPCRFVVGPGQN